MVGVAGVGDWLAGATRLGRGGARRVRQATHAQGAGASGLGRLIELHAVDAGGDALVALSLAGTLFFGVPVGEARSSVGLYLLVTMAPFAVVAPVLGPALDRLRHGRRWALSATLALRAVLAWFLAAAVANDDAMILYPAAFGVLVLAKAYGVTKAAAMPRLLPPGIGLVKANARVSLAGVISALVAAGLGAGVAALTGPEWVLRVAVVVFAVGAVLAVRLPRRVDHDPREDPPHEHRTSDAMQGPGPKTAAPGLPRLPRVWPGEVALGLRANAAIRAFSGFLLFFLAFLLRTDPVSGLAPAVAIGVVLAAAAVGGGTGTTLGASLRDRTPEGIMLVVLGAAATCSLVSAWLYGIASIALVALAAGLAQSLGKLSLDAVIQREVPERVRSSAFARSEALLQLSWVVGAGVGTVLPLRGDLGLGVAAAVLVAVLVSVLVSRRGTHSRPTAPPTHHGG